MKTFTDAEVAKALRETVEGREDYVYDSGRINDGGCYYSMPNGSPSCLVGFVVAKLNPDAFEKVVEWEDGGDFGDVADMTNVTDGEFNISTEVRRALQAAQEKQDSGAPWGEALDAFEAAYDQVNGEGI